MSEEVRVHRAVQDQSESERLNELLARVEAATGPDRDIDAHIAVELSGDDGAWVVNPAPHSIFSAAPGWWRTSDDKSHSAPEFTASLDAALALVEQVLPGTEYEMTNLYCVPMVTLPLNMSMSLDPQTARLEHGTLPLAVCAALLRAVQAQPLRHDARDGARTQSEPANTKGDGRG